MTKQMTYMKSPTHEALTKKTNAIYKTTDARTTNDKTSVLQVTTDARTTNDKTNVVHESTGVGTIIDKTNVIHETTNAGTTTSGFRDYFWMGHYMPNKGQKDV